jgi:hypothetical protein
MSDTFITETANHAVLATAGAVQLMGYAFTHAGEKVRDTVKFSGPGPKEIFGGPGNDECSHTK